MSRRRDTAGYAGDFDRLRASAIDLCPELNHTGERGSAVSAGGEIGEVRSALGETAEHGVAMADGFVAGQAKAADDISSGPNQSFVGSGVQRISGVNQLLATSL